MVTSIWDAKLIKKVEKAHPPSEKKNDQMNVIFATFNTQGGGREPFNWPVGMESLGLERYLIYDTSCNFAFIRKWQETKEALFWRLSKRNGSLTATYRWCMYTLENVFAIKTFSETNIFNSRSRKIEHGNNFNHLISSILTVHAPWDLNQWF